MILAIPEFAMVCLVGTSGSGKSTFARKHFAPTQILSSDAYRGYVCDDENSQEASAHAFEALHFMLSKRLQLGRTTVIDATNVQKDARAALLKIASQWHALKVAIVLDVPERVCHDRNASRPDRQFGPHVVRNQHRALINSLRMLRKEGWHKIYVLKPDDIEAATLTVEPIWSRKPHEHGPFDIIGDVHGCLAELQELLAKLGWVQEPELHHPEGRKLVFVGDLVDRGPDSVGVLRLAMDAVGRGVALAVPGNHDVKLARALFGKKVTLNHGLKETMDQLAAETPEFREEVKTFLDGLVSHALMDDGKLCVAHAGLREEMQGRGSRAVREFALYGETTGEIDEFGLPVRYEWAREYRGNAKVVFGHTPVPAAQWLNNTIDIDTGCCFGGSLTALRYPEMDLVSVKSHAVYAEPARPLVVAPTQLEDEVLDLQDILGRRSVETRLAGRVTVREENAIAALEVMSRFACDPHWLVYLPPTMAPCATSDRPGFLEYPTEAFDYYRREGVSHVVCEEKHMGSRAVAVIGRSPEAAASRFGVVTGEQGIITTRTGRRFFEELETEQALVQRMAMGAEAAGLWEELETDWMVIDLELMPWSAKAVGLLREQYAPVGAAANASAASWLEVARKLADRVPEGAEELLAVAQTRVDSAFLFREAYRRYCWTVSSLDDYRLAPFHLLASEGRVHVDKDHVWHMTTLAKMCECDPGILVKTPYRVVELGDESQTTAACQWWEDLVGQGREGMVVKPMDFVVPARNGLIQPAVKCRGPEYLRIIYGPEYLSDANLSRLRQRGLGRKQGLAMREFALGVEAMERFVRRESLRRVHECVFGVLALESEPVDPRL